MMNLRHKHILITGSAKRIGRAIAEALLPYQVKLTAHYFKSKDKADELTEIATPYQSKVQTICADLTKVKEAKNLYEKANAKFGKIDILVNSASDFFPTPDCKEEQWDRLMNLNAKIPYFLSEWTAREMVKTSGGVIINIIDVNIYRPLPFYTAYTASKCAFSGVTKSLAKEYAPKVRVNSISPGMVLAQEGTAIEVIEKAKEKTLLKKLGEPCDVVNAVLFLIKNEYLTGIDLIVDGGRGLI